MLAPADLGAKPDAGAARACTLSEARSASETVLTPKPVAGGHWQIAGSRLKADTGIAGMLDGGAVRAGSGAGIGEGVIIHHGAPGMSARAKRTLVAALSTTMLTGARERTCRRQETSAIDVIPAHPSCVSTTRESVWPGSIEGGNGILAVCAVKHVGRPLLVIQGGHRWTPRIRGSH